MSVEDGKATVLFVDYGNCDTVDVNTLRIVSEKFISVPPYALSCRLGKLAPTSGHEQEALDLFNSLTQEKELNAAFSGTPTSIRVDLSTEDDGDLSKKILEAGFVHEVETKVEQECVQKFLLAAIPQKPEPCYVSHASSIQNFYLQLSSQEDALNELVAQLESDVASNQLQELTCPVVGGACYAQFTDDGAWYRAQISSLQGDKATVLFVDYGNCDTVDVNSLKSVSKELVSIPPYAVHCCLGNLMPASGQKQEALDLFNSLTGDKTVTAVFGGMPSPIRVQLTTEEDGDLNEKVTESGFACEMDAPPQQISTQMFLEAVVPSQPEVCFVSHVSSLEDFYLQLSNQEIELSEMAAQLNVDLSNSQGQPLTCPVVGAACCAQYSEDESWYRARILAIEGGNATVLFVDYGNCDTVDVNMLKIVSEKFISVPPYALSCRLGKLAPTSGHEQEALDLFNSLTQEELTAAFSGTPTSIRVDLSTEDDGDLSKKILEAGLVHEVETKVEDGVLANKLLESGFTSDIEVPHTGSPTLPLPVLPDEPVQCFVTNVASMHSIHLQLASQESAVNDLAEQLAEAFSEDKGVPLANPAVGVVCGALYSEDNCWYRAQITSMQGGEANVKFVDYGNCSSTAVQGLKILPVNLISLPPYALECTLTNLAPVPGNEEKALELLDSLVQDKELTCVFSGTPTSINVVISTDDNCDIATSLLESGLVLNVPLVENNVQVAVEDKIVSDNAIEVNAENLENSDTLVEESVEVQVEDIVADKAFEVSAENKLVADMLVELEEPPCPVNDDVSDEHQSEQAPEEAVENGEILSKALTTSSVTQDSTEKLDVRMGEERSKGSGGISQEETDEFSKEETDDISKEESDEISKEESDEISKEVTDEISREETDEISREETDEFSKEESDEISKEVTDEISQEETDENSLEESSRFQDEMTLKDVPRLELPVLPSGPQTCFTSHVSSLENFYLQLANQESALQELAARLNDTFAEGAGEQLSNPMVGMVCCCQFSEDDSWYRALITSIEDNKATVTFMDYGNSDIVELSSLKSAVDGLNVVPAFAWKCRLGHLVPVVEKEHEASELFLSLTKDAELTAVFSGRDDGFIIAFLSSEADGDLSQKLKERGLVVEKAVNDINVQDSCNHLSLPTVVIPNEDEICFVSNSGQGPNNFFLQLASQEEALSQLNLQVGQAYSAEQNNLKETVPGDLCCAQFAVDGAWYRACILSVDGEEVTVMFVDYGNIECVARSSLRLLLPQFRSQPPFAYKCCMSSLKVVPGEEESALHHFVDLTQDKELTVTFQSSAVDEVFRVKLSDQVGDLTKRLLDFGMVPETDVEDKSQDGLQVVTGMEKEKTDNEETS